LPDNLFRLDPGRGKEVKTAFDKIAAGLKDAIAYAGGDVERGHDAQAGSAPSRRLTTEAPASLAKPTR
jgi:hypothetical protein